MLNRFLHPTYGLFFIAGTPTEEAWPGISSNEEFKAYNFPKYKPQQLINHAPRYYINMTWLDSLKYEMSCDSCFDNYGEKCFNCESRTKLATRLGRG